MTQSRDPALYLTDILENIQYIEIFTAEGKEDFNHSKKTQYAVLKCLENIGEAVKNIPEEYKNILPEIAWKGASRARDFFVHHYFGIDTDMIWSIIGEDIPPLKNAVEQIISQVKQSQDQSSDQGMSM